MHARAIGVGEVIPPVDHRASALDLIVRASRTAIQDAGLEPSAIDGVVTTGRATLPNLMHPTEGSGYLAEYLGIPRSMHRTLAYGGVGALGCITEAIMMLNAGMANYVLVVAGDTPRREKSISGTVELYASGMREVYEQSYGASVVTAYSLAATRHMALYGSKPEEFAAIPVAARKHAARNPAALFREPLTVEDVLESRMISSPSRLLDCCPITDGAAAVVLSAVDAPAPEGRKSVRITSGPELFTYQSITLNPDVLELNCGPVANDVFRRAGIDRNDVDVIHLYDNFSVHPVLQLESMGFCAKGEGASFVSSGAIDPTGELPLNPNGGLLACVNPGIASQLFFVTEAVQQLRGEANERQIESAEVAVMSAPAGYQSWYQVLVAQAE
jgi:acetyl-CoA acetyltransferase